MPLTSDLLRGQTDAIILAYLNRGDSYGYQINKDIQEATEGSFELKEATLYTAFRRLEETGLIASYWGTENVGARRRYYSITDAGRAAHTQNTLEWTQGKKIMDKLLANK